ncbi:MAG TPA: FtsX-like permease family protein [Kofleriaceae bacterium]
MTERTREIGARMAVGALSWHILGQFLAEALSLSLAGCALGIALGLTIAGQLASRFHMPSVIHWDVIALGGGRRRSPAVRAVPRARCRGRAAAPRAFAVRPPSAATTASATTTSARTAGAATRARR